MRMRMSEGVYVDFYNLHEDAGLVGICGCGSR